MLIKETPCGLSDCGCGCSKGLGSGSHAGHPSSGGGDVKAYRDYYGGFGDYPNYYGQRSAPGTIPLTSSGVGDYYGGEKTRPPGSYMGGAWGAYYGQPQEHWRTIHDGVGNYVTVKNPVSSDRLESTMNTGLGLFDSTDFSTWGVAEYAVIGLGVYVLASLFGDVGRGRKKVRKFQSKRKRAAKLSREMSSL